MTKLTIQNHGDAEVLMNSQVVMRNTIRYLSCRHVSLAHAEHV